MRKKVFLSITFSIVIILLIGIIAFKILGLTFFIRQETPQKAILLHKWCNSNDITFLLTDGSAGIASVQANIQGAETLILHNGTGGWYIIPSCFQSFQKSFLTKEPPSSSSVGIFQIEKKTIVVVTIVTDLPTIINISDNINSIFSKNVFEDLNGRITTYLLSLDGLPENYELYINGETIKVN